MNRPIKFRGWHKKKKEMDMHAHGRAYFGSRAENGHVFDDIVLMQFTGLTDKNGKEIYEGDILDGHIDVGMENGCFEDVRFEVAWNSNGYWDWVAPPQECEVIGNIYENPDLLSV